jgi:hypothetical protein
MTKERAEEIIGEKDEWITNGVPFTVSTIDAISAILQAAKEDAIAYNNWIETFGNKTQAKMQFGIVTDDLLYSIYQQQNEQQ